MNRFKFFSKPNLLILFLVFAFLSCAWCFQPVSAASPPSGQGLEISPPLIELKTDPGKTVIFNIRLRNVTQSGLKISTSVEDFVASGEDGKPKLLLDKNAEPSPYSFKPWIKSLPDLTLAPQQLKTVKVTMVVPKDASPGGHYGVIRFSVQPTEGNGSRVSLSASLGALVLADVSGDVKTKASLSDYFTEQNGKKGSFFENGPLTFVERVKNEGNVHFKPTGTVRVTDMFGRNVKVLSVNKTAGNVLPSSIRRFEQKLNKKPLFGRYVAEANIQYSGKSLHEELVFWIIPYKIIAIGLGLLILLAVAFRVGLKRYNRHIIDKAGRKSHNKKPK